MLFYVKRSLAYGQRVPNPNPNPNPNPSLSPVVGTGGTVTNAVAPITTTHTVNSAVGGKGVATKQLGVGGKGGHPIRGMEV